MQMAQYEHPYNPIPTIYKLPVQQPNQLNRKPEEWKDYMEHEISSAAPMPGDSMAVNISTFHKAKVIGFVLPALFEVKPQSYCPRILTIGPLFQNLEPSPMDRCKAVCVNKFMDRHGISNVGEIMKELIPDPDELSNIYFGLSPAYNFESLRLLVTVDTVFIHEFFLFLSEDCPASEDQKSGYLYTFINNDITSSQIWRDLLLIGNQIPMLFLKKLINIPKKSPDFRNNDLLACLDYFVYINDPFLISRLRWENNETEGKQADKKHLLDCEHLLDCLYVSCTQGSPKHSPEPQKSTSRSRCLQVLNILWGCKKSKTQDDEPPTASNLFKAGFRFNRPPTASNLSKAGVQFKVCEGNISLKKYDKRKRRLYLPRLVVYDNTEDVLRNLIAHEQISKEGEVSGYATIMKLLIDTQEDIAILTEAKVLENHLVSDEKLIQMWCDMCTNIVVQNNQKWYVLEKDLKEHCVKTHRHDLYVEFHEKYFSRPWLWIKLLAATLLLIFTLLQTIFSILGYYHDL